MSDKDLGTSWIQIWEQVGYKSGSKCNTNKTGHKPYTIWELAGYKSESKSDTNLGASRIKILEQAGYKSDSKSNKNMGTSLIQNGTISLANLGDSCGFILKDNGTMRKVTVD